MAKTKLAQAMDDAAAAEGKSEELRKAGFADGAEYARTLIAGEIQHEGSFASMLVHVAEMDSKEAMEGFADGFRNEADNRTKKGTKAEKDAATKILQKASRIGRVIRAVYGTTKKDGTVGVKAIGQERTIAILSDPKGTWHEKMEKLPSTRTESKGPAETPIQRRLSAVEQPEGGIVVPKLETMAQALGLPMTGKNKVTGEALEKLSARTIVGGIKSAPDSMLGDIVESVIARCRVSSDKFWQEFGENVRSHWLALAAQEARAPKAKAKAQPLAVPK